LHVESGKVVLAGQWTLAAMLPELPALRQQLASLGPAAAEWDLSALSRLDSAAAMLLWRSWNNAWPAELTVSAVHRQVLARVADLPEALPAPPAEPFRLVEALGRRLLRGMADVHGMVVLLGQLLLDCGHLLRHPGDVPWRELAANIYKSGTQALPVTALVGFLIGITISYLSALQLRSFGADTFIVNILGISIVRELGPVLRG
jgi:phospholipid/cholesterol/gamma-HCH transport system permease protein